MIKIIKYSDKNFNTNLEKIINLKRLQSSTIELKVKKILDDIKKNKDEALFKYAKKFDNISWNLTWSKTF